MMNDGLVSCIITTYKRDIDVLGRAVSSVLSQTYENIELLVINDYPEDADLASRIGVYLRQFERIRYIIHEKNSGACAARNTGIANAVGEYIAFLDDDDEWLPEKIAVQVQVIRDCQADMVFCPFIKVEKNGSQKISAPYSGQPGIADKIHDVLMVRNCIGSTSIPLIRKDILDTTGGFDTNLKASQDLDMWIRISGKFSVAYSHEPLLKYYFSDDAITRSITNRLQAFEYINKKYEDFFEKNPGIYNNRLNECACMLIGGYKNYRYAFRYWLKAVRVCPFSRNNFLAVKKVLSRLKKDNADERHPHENKRRSGIDR